MTDNAADKPPQRENLLLNLLFNIVIPTVILTKFSGEAHLGPQLGIVVALAFPVIYGVKDYFRLYKINFFSALGVFNVMMTGGMSLLEIDPKYIAIKEAAIPAAFGIATLITLKTKYPLVKVFLFNDMVMKTDKVHEALERYNAEAQFNRALVVASAMLAGSFFLSSLLNYILATVLLVSEPGTEAFNAELGKMTALSFPIIALPAMLVMMAALFYLFRQIKLLTRLELEDILRNMD